MPTITEAQSATQAATAQKEILTARESAGQVAEKTYYSRNKGTRFCFPDGEIAEFVYDPSAQISFYKTKSLFEQKELDASTRINPNILSFTPCAVKISDATILRDVSNAGSAKGTGMASSASLAAFAAPSSSSK